MASLVSSVGVDAFALQRLLQSFNVPIRFAHDPSMHVAAKEIARVDVWDRAVTVTSGFLGLTGTTSPLPEETLAALQETVDGDEGHDLGAFVQLIEHRLLQLLHRGVSLSTLDANQVTTLDDTPSVFLQWPVAYAPFVRPRLRLAAWAALHKAQCSHDDVVWAIRQVLLHAGHDVLVRLVPLVNPVRPLDESQLWRLGEASSVLAQSAVLGPYAGAVQGGVRLELTACDPNFFLQTKGRKAQLREDIAAMLNAVLPKTVRWEVWVHAQMGHVAPFALGEDVPPQPIMPDQLCGWLGLGLSTRLAGPIPSDVAPLFWFDMAQDAMGQGHDVPC